MDTGIGVPEGRVIAAVVRGLTIGGVSRTDKHVATQYVMRSRDDLIQAGMDN